MESNNDLELNSVGSIRKIFKENNPRVYQKFKIGK